MPDSRGNGMKDTNNIEEAMWQLKIQRKDSQERVAAQSLGYPDRPGEPNCIHYVRTGNCGYGSSCRFNHPAYHALGALHGGELPERVGEPDCEFYLKRGICKYGPSCKFNHPRDRHGADPVSFNILGLPMRQEEKACPHYMRTGYCKFGPACKFNHPPPMPPGTNVAAFGSSIVPSPSLPYFGGLPAWQSPPAAYLSGPHLHSPQPYMPLVISPSQGILPGQGWNSYLGNSGPLSSSGVRGSSLAHSSRHLGEPGSNGQVQLFSTSMYPERPDQPVCRYFMNSGTCKYGPDCKYNHPTERILQHRSTTVGPHGLPLRPGLPVCSHYSLFGLCQYGLACEFDHPLGGYSYSHGLNLPYLPALVPSVFYQNNSPNALSSDTSPSKPAQHPDWVLKPHTPSNKNQNLDTKSSQNLHQHVGSPTNSLQTTSESHDVSD